MAGETPLELADRVVKRFQALWEKLNISYSDFIRTTQERHKKGVSHLFTDVMAKGDIYLGEYEDWYCTPCETFWTETQLIDFKCPDCNRPTEKLKEESFFFRMSKYQEALLAHIEANPEFIQPKSRRNEILSFVREGLRDLSISRTTFQWGIPVPGNDSHVVYVWFDALANYITALGYPETEGKFREFWPADVQLIGKDILRFHAVYWPTFLLSAGLPLPKKVFAHGWWTVEGQKMSKSLQNVIEPNMLIDKYGVDAIRYFLLREVPFGLDGDFSHSALIHRINSDLANDLGNLLNRSTAMIQKYFGGVVQQPAEMSGIDKAYRVKTEAAVDQVESCLEEMAFSKALQSIWEVISAGNKYIDETAPWTLAKDPAQKERLGTVMYCVLESQRIVYHLLSAFMPDTADKGLHYLGWDKAPAGDQLSWGQLQPGTKIIKAEALFPRIDEKGEA
jgi:methionyl-tRNA synthetase